MKETDGIKEAERRIKRCRERHSSGLDLVGLSLHSLPENISALTWLERLDIDFNYITEIPKWICKLTKLETFGIEGNELTELPQELKELHDLRLIVLDGNPDLGLPDEIIDTCDARKILDYYFRIAAPDARQPLNEFKLVLVGRGGVGKTTLVHRLITNVYEEFKRTPGIQITKWPLIVDSEDVRAHVWDFGGQEIMHGTHRFFMTERALYLVLISGREGTEDHDAEYWLSLVRSFAGDVPIIVLLHKWDDYSFELNRELLREKYGRDIIFLETDSETGHGINRLREELCDLARKLPGLKTAWPKAWRSVKDELPAQKKHWLTFDDFCEFCAKRRVTERQDQEALAESLHDLGLMLSYRKEEALRHFGVLNPQWATKGIYAMLNSRILRDASGKFTVQTFSEVLPRNAYPAVLHPYLLALMRKFRLCHPLDEKGNRFLIPELLTKEEPPLDVEFPADTCLNFAYRYDSVLPEGLLPRFIVETYVHREPTHAWRTGVVLERANCRALVRGDVQGRKITIRVAGVGNGRRELLGIIRQHFERIHKSYEKLPVTEMVPIPGYPEVEVPHGLLLTYEREREEQILVQVGQKLHRFSVRDLVDGTDMPGAVLPGHLNAIWHERVFITYSRKDAVFLDQLRAALVPYERRGELEIWTDFLVEPGQNWEEEIISHLSRAKIIIMLLSNNFLASADCMEKELPRAMARHEKGECVIVPIVVRPCRYDKLPIGKLQAIQPGGKSIQEHTKKDPAWFEVTKELDRVIAHLKAFST